MNLHLAPFRFDVSPPIGHSLCGGWIVPAKEIDDPLEAIGLVLLGAGKPIVLCAVDWTGLLNSAHLMWRQALADAAGTTVDRVTVHCVHQHDAPFACLDAERIVQQHADLPHIIEPGFFDQCLERARAAVRGGLKRSRKCTHVAHGQAQVQRVTSNRRIIGPDNKVEHMRSVSPNSSAYRHLPEGLIDPWLKQVAFFDGGTKIAACHYYAVHPISYCCQEGRVTSEFVGLARKRLQKSEPDCTHVYFTACAGDQNTGKYNNSAVKENRAKLTDRMHLAMVAAGKDLMPDAVDTLTWQTQEILPPPRSIFNQAEIAREIANKDNRIVHRNRPSYALAWLRRMERKQPIATSCLHINDASLLHLPAECFVDYQLRAQKMQPERFVATAAYGDGGPWYIPTADAYPQGGYEVSVAFCDPEVDSILTDAIHKLLGPA